MAAGNSHDVGLPLFGLGTANQVPKMNAGATAPEWAALTTLLDTLFGSTRGTILRRGATEWEGLAKATQGSVFTAGASDADWATVSALLDDAIGTTIGGILYRNATDWTKIVPVAAGHVMTDGGPGVPPSWQAPAAGADGPPGADGADGLLRDVLIHETAMTSETWTETVDAGKIANVAGSGLSFEARIKMAAGSGTIKVNLDATTMIQIPYSNSTVAYGILSGRIMRAASNELEVDAHFGQVDGGSEGGELELADYNNNGGANFAITLSADPFDLTIESTTAADEVQAVLVRHINGVATDPVTTGGETTGTFEPGTAGWPTVMVERTKTAAPGLYRWDGASLTTVEATFGTGTAAETGVSTGTDARANAWVEFMGKEYVVHTVSTTSHRIYERPIGGTTTGAAVRTATLTTTSRLKSGLYVVNNGTQQLLCFVYIGSALASSLCMETFDGTTWTTYTNIPGTSVGAATPGAINSYGVAIHGTSLYVPCINGSTCQGWVVDVVNGSAAIIGNLGLAIHGTFVTMYGRVFYMTATSNTSAQRQLYEWTSGALTSILTFTGSGGEGSTLNGAIGCMIPYGDDLLCIYASNAGATAGNVLFRASLAVFASSGATPTETTKANFLPAAMEAAGGAVGHCVSYFMDTQTDPGSPSLWVMDAVNAGTMKIAQVVDADTEITFTDTGLASANYAWPMGQTTMGGERISPDDTDNAIFKALSGARGTGVYTITFKLDAQNAGDTWTVKLWASQKRNGVFAQATLTGSPSGGASRVGNEVRGVPDDTTVSFDWDLGADGIADNAQFWLKLKAYRE